MTPSISPGWPDANLGLGDVEGPWAACPLATPALIWEER